MHIGNNNKRFNFNRLIRDGASAFVASVTFQLFLGWVALNSATLDLTNSQSALDITAPSVSRIAPQGSIQYSEDSQKLLSYIVNSITAHSDSYESGHLQTIQVASSKFTGPLMKSALQKDTALFQKERVISGTIRSSFFSAANEAGVPSSVLDDFVDMIGDRLNFNRDLKAGDTFSLLFDQRQTAFGEVVHVGELKAASIRNNGKLIAAIRYKGKNGKVSVYDETGKTHGNFFLSYPVQFTKVTSVFSDDRLHPVLKIHKPHNGVDFAASIGTPIRTVGDGVVEQVGYFGGAGNMVKISHGGGYATAYLHMSKITPGLRKGVKVNRGDILGTVGMTGLATGPHLHFSLFKNDSYIDPLSNKLPNILSEKDLAPPKFIQATLQALQTGHNEVVLAANAVSNKKG